MRDLIPLYAVYALLFADTGLSTAEITSLFVIWSVTAFVLEVPSGAWADTVSRRGLLVLSSVLYAGCFAVWTFVPSYPAFAVGFVLWGLSGALMSGTFEALLYDELAALGETRRYAGLIGRAEALAMAFNLVATLAAAPLMVVGGYVLVGVVSTGVALLQCAFALTLPSAPRVVSAQGDPEDDSAVEDVTPSATIGVATRYVTMLRAGLHEVRCRPVVRRGVLLGSVLYGLTAFDEYFGLLALDKRADPESVPLLVGLTVAGQLVGTATAGRTVTWSRRAVAGLVAVAAVTLVAGSLLAHPWVAFAAVGIGYGLLSNASVVADARLQDAITGPARATVTSATGVGSEVVALGAFAAFAVGPLVGTIGGTMAVLSALVLPIAVLVPRWLPSARRVEPDVTRETLVRQVDSTPQVPR